MIRVSSSYKNTPRNRTSHKITEKMKSYPTVKLDICFYFVEPSSANLWIRLTQIRSLLSAEISPQVRLVSTKNDGRFLKTRRPFPQQWESLVFPLVPTFPNVICLVSFAPPELRFPCICECCLHINYWEALWVKSRPSSIQTHSLDVPFDKYLLPRGRDQHSVLSIVLLWKERLFKRHDRLCFHSFGILFFNCFWNANKMKIL